MLVISFQIQDDFLGRVYIPFNLVDVNNRDTFPVVRGIYMIVWVYRVLTIDLVIVVCVVV